MHTDHNIKYRDPSFDHAGARGHEWRLFLLNRDCAQADAAYPFSEVHLTVEGGFAVEWVSSGCGRPQPMFTMLLHNRL